MGCGCKNKLKNRLSKSIRIEKDNLKMQNNESDKNNK